MRSTGGRWRQPAAPSALLRPYRWRVAARSASLVLATAAALAPPPLATLAIDNGIIPRDVDTLNLVVVGFVVSALVLWGATWLETYLVGWVGQRVLQDLRVEVFSHLQRLSIGF